MDVLDRVRILAAAARYDASCASSGSVRRNDGRSLGNSATASMGICHTWAADGRCVSLLKILFSNYCVNDCAYCVNRRSNDVPRASFRVQELVDLTVSFYRRNYIEGLFLSSGVFGSPDETMEVLLLVARKLRLDEHFHGYIHMKVIPGASPELIRRAGLFADRLSVNIELPSEKSLVALAPDKTRQAILGPMALIGSEIRAREDEARRSRRVPLFVPAGQSTQLIVGATPDTDFQIVRLAEQLYRKINLRRVYYSAYVPVNGSRLLPALATPPFRREHRLYQADWLIRLYGFRADEVVDASQPFLDLDLDPKTSWALRNLDRFPVEVNRADFASLLRVPGIGRTSAERIVAARRHGALRPDDLPRLGVVMKRARYFVTCQGRAFERLDRLESASAIRGRLIGDKRLCLPPGEQPRQLSLFDGLPGASPQASPDAGSQDWGIDWGIQGWCTR
ncbi:MAG: putative DNA modification/repair radical SAM protein [Clostridia bacterium]